MPSNTTPSPGYLIDGRVFIALDALNKKQKEIVGNAIADREHFLAITTDRRKVDRLATKTPLFSMRLPSGLRIIYSQTGDDIVVMDLMKQSTLDWFGGTAKGRRTRKTRRPLALKKGTRLRRAKQKHHA